MVQISRRQKFIEIKDSGGGYITGKVPGVSSFKDLFNPTLNLGYSKSLRVRFGENKATDNYKKNKGN